MLGGKTARQSNVRVRATQHTRKTAGRKAKQGTEATQGGKAKQALSRPYLGTGSRTRSGRERGTTHALEVLSPRERSS